MRNYRSFSIVFLIFVNMIALWGQGNLISNPSFEEDPLHSGVNIDTDPMYIRSSGQRPHTRVVINKYFVISCPDCYTIKKCHSGNNCVVLYNSASMGEGSPYRSLIQGKLIKPLEKDSTYFFVAYLCNSYTNPYNPEIPLILLKESVFSDKLPLRLSNYQKLRVPVARDSSWQKISISFTADDNYRYFILGEADEKAPVIKIPGEKYKTIQSVIDDLWLSRNPVQVIEAFDTPVTRTFEQKFFFDTGESEIINRDGTFSDLEPRNITVDSITIHSYTDGQGSVEANIELSALRSKAARDFLPDQFKEVPANKIRMYNFGESACGEISNPECRYSLLKIYYHEDNSVPESVTESGIKQYFSPIVLSTGDTVFVINQHLDFKEARRKREYHKAIEFTKQEKYNGKWGVLNERAEMWSLLGACDSAMTTLSLMYEKNPDRRGDWDFSNPNFLNCINNSIFQGLQEKYIASYKSDTVQFPNITTQLWRAHIKDQGPYELIQSLEKFPQERSAKIIDSLWTMKKKYQHENEDLLLSMIDSIGWPTISKVGKTASTYAFLIVQHSSDFSFQQKLLDTIRLHALAGEISSGSYAYLADRVSLHTTGKQLCGTQVLKQSDGTYKIAPYDDLKSLLGNREKYQLGDWNAYLQRFGLEVKY